VYFNADGLTLQAYDAESYVDDDMDPMEWARSWYRFDRGYAEPIGTCSVAAYNLVATAFARFFALREHLMRTRGAWWTDTNLRARAQASRDPSMVAELRKPPPPILKGRTTTSTRPIDVPVPTKKLQPTKPVRVGRVAAKPVRVGRATLADVLAAPTMAEMQRRLVKYKAGR